MEGADSNPVEGNFTLQTFSEEELSKDIMLVGKLEDYCSSGEFTQIMQEFGELHCMKFEATEEQDLDCYTIYQEYCKLLDNKLEEFLKNEGIRAEDMYKSCQRVQQMESGSLMCLEWILASTDYIEFVLMMLQFREAKEWANDEEEEGEQAE
ncbi:UNKNOWN [Stylonychia lemnae]|uniref:Cilia- and flagella-associated protein 36 n=1 Tax=Stylonychia lemnae TaxID=5949 RepID=A0A078AE18_STYLE|nr:UNKNOWN [Stylonychia lemnae]|eukprot:CDW79158.1 UNKNOWN [Stylonychia lemnae]